MDVFLDTNIYLTDIRFEKHIATLCDYLLNTQGHLVMNDVVRIEVPEVYRRQINDVLKEQKK